VQLKNRLLPFFGKTIGFFIVIAVVWYYLIGPVYNDVLAACADFLTPGAEVFHHDNTIHVFKDSTSSGIYAFQLQYGLILVMALIAATTAISIKKRLIYIPIALLSIFLVHVISIVVFSWATQYDSPGSHPLYILFAVFGSSLFPIVVWGIFSFRYLLPKPQEPIEVKSQPRLKGKKRSKVKD